MISPHFPPNFEPFAERLYKSGVNTLAIADVPYEALSDNLKSNLTEYYRVDDMEDYSQVYRAVAYFAHKYGRIDRIESHNEYWLSLDARLRTDFNVFGLKYNAIPRIREKSVQKAHFKKIGAPVAQGFPAKGERTIRKTAKKLGLPIIAKPNDGVGASDTWKIFTPSQLETFIEEHDPECEYILEQFITGNIETYDGLTDQDGKVVFESSFIYDRPALEILIDGKGMHYDVPRKLPKDVVKMGRKIVENYDLKERFFHFEFFRLEDGSIMPLEINCRPGGGMSIDMINYANDIDLFEEYKNIVLENKFKASTSRPYYVSFISRRFNINYTHSIEEALNRYGDDIVKHAVNEPLFREGMGDYYFIIRTADKKRFDEIIDYLTSEN